MSTNLGGYITNVVEEKMDARIVALNVVVISAMWIITFIGPQGSRSIPYRFIALPGIIPFTIALILGMFDFAREFPYYMEFAGGVIAYLGYHMVVYGEYSPSAILFIPVGIVMMVEPILTGDLKTRTLKGMVMWFRYPEKLK